MLVTRDGALLTNSVIGLTGSPGITTATNGACPALGVASAVAQADAHRPGAVTEDGVDVRGLGALTDVALADEHLGLLGAETRESCCTRTISGPAPRWQAGQPCSRHGGRKPGHRPIRFGAAGTGNNGLPEAVSPIRDFLPRAQLPSCRAPASTPAGRARAKG